MVRNMHLRKAGDANRFWVEVIKDFGQRPPHVRHEERIDVFVWRRIAFVLQGPHRARPLQRQHDAVDRNETDRVQRSEVWRNSQRSYVLPQLYENPFETTRPPQSSPQHVKARMMVRVPPFASNARRTRCALRKWH